MKRYFYYSYYSYKNRKYSKLYFCEVYLCNKNIVKLCERNKEIGAIDYSRCQYYCEHALICYMLYIINKLKSLVEYFTYRTLIQLHTAVSSFLSSLFCCFYIYIVKYFLFNFIILHYNINI